MMRVHNIVLSCIFSRVASRASSVDAIAHYGILLKIPSIVCSQALFASINLLISTGLGSDRSPSISLATWTSS